MFYHCLQKIIYKSLKITGAVRVIKGQEVLPDGSTLDEQGIIDGSTVNIVIEPDKEITIQIMLGPQKNKYSLTGLRINLGLKFTQKVLNSVRVRELKQQLIDGGSVGFMMSEFTLMIPADDNDGVTADVLLEDELLPLHLYGVGDNTKIKIIGWSIMIEVINQKGKQRFKYFPRKMTVKQIKKEIQTEHISLFLKRAMCYRKLDDETPIGEVLSHKDVVHYIENPFFWPHEMIQVIFKDVTIEKIGHVHKETVLSVKLRIQEHLGFPVSSLQVRRLIPNVQIIMGNNDIMDFPAKNYRVYVS